MVNGFLFLIASVCIIIGLYMLSVKTGCDEHDRLVSGIIVLIIGILLFILALKSPDLQQDADNAKSLLTFFLINQSHSVHHPNKQLT